MTEDLYVNETYKQGHATELPSDAELDELFRKRFTGTDLDFTYRLEIMKAAGVNSGARVLDFGSSWGYGSWQMTQAGYSVFSYEVGAVRSRFAGEKLGCTVVTDLVLLQHSIDCFISAHVIEHLPTPQILFDAARQVLKPGGILICFCPNGAVEREKADVKNYDLNWGMVHPMMLTPEYMHKAAAGSGFSPCDVYSDATQGQVEERNPGSLAGSELLMIAWRAD